MLKLQRLAVATVLATALAAAAQPSPYAWKSVTIHGMGYVTGLVIHPLPPHDIYIRTDVGGAYRFDRGARRWLPLLDPYGIANLGVFGVESIAVDPGDPNTVYIFAGLTRVIDGSGNDHTYGEVMVSHSRGADWQATGFAQQTAYIGANDPYGGTTGEKLAVDPNRSQRIYLGTRQNGLWVKDGTVWQAVGGGLPAMSSLPTTANTPGFTFVVCDPASGPWLPARLSGCTRASTEAASG